MNDIQLKGLLTGLIKPEASNPAYLDNHSKEALMSGVEILAKQPFENTQKEQLRNIGIEVYNAKNKGRKWRYINVETRDPGIYEFTKMC